MTLTPARPNEENPTIIRSVYYIHSMMRRIDKVDASGNITFTKINNCATSTGFIVNLASQQYRHLTLPRVWTEQQLRDYISNHPADAVRIESRTVDTGERKVIFGLTAKHFITTVERPTINGSGGSETIDGWYVEHERVDCGALSPFDLGAILVSYPELPDAHHVGPVPTGLAVQVTDTIRWTGSSYGATGRTMTSELTVESIADSTLDPRIFDIPAGFRENPELLK